MSECASERPRNDGTSPERGSSSDVPSFLLNRCIKPIAAGRITRVFQFASGLEAKRLGLLDELIPKATTIAVLVNPNFSDAENLMMMKSASCWARGK